jgi:hypothetical protein
MPGLDDPSVATMAPHARARLAAVPRTVRSGAPVPLPALVRAVRWRHGAVDRRPPRRSGHADPRGLPPRQPVLCGQRRRRDDRLAARHARTGPDRHRLLLREQPDRRCAPRARSSPRAALRRGTHVGWRARRRGHRRRCLAGLPRGPRVLRIVVRGEPAHDRPGQRTWCRPVRHARPPEVHCSRRSRCGARDRPVREAIALRPESADTVPT